jgi:adenosylmethionine---8-amino-7-oxononanoate aminotransferase
MHARPDHAALSERYADLLEKNRRYLWNPFTQMKGYLESEPLIVERADGVRLLDVDGRSYYDGNSSMWLNVHGHRKAELDRAIAAQLGRVGHSTLLGQGSVPAIELAERLVGIVPEGLGKVFYSDSGAEAVEIALKMAIGYWRRLGRPEKRVLLSMRNAYHGDTVGAVSVGGIDLFHAEFEPLLFPTRKVSYPYPYRFAGTEAECAAACLAELEADLAARGEETAALVVEPIVQGAAGMIVMPRGFLRELAELCRRHEVLLIADEVATGFGRTGRMFACEHEGVHPDLLTAGKGITGGYLPLAATFVTDAIYDVYLGEHADLRTFYHGHSYTGNQLACAAALASLDLFERDGLVERVRGSAELAAARLAGISELPHVGEVRQRGLMVGVELVADRASKEPFDWTLATGARVCRRARELGMITRPLGDVVTFLPPLASEADDLEAMLAILGQAIAEAAGEDAP